MKDHFILPDGYMLRGGVPGCFLGLGIRVSRERWGWDIVDEENNMSKSDDMT